MMLEVIGAVFVASIVWAWINDRPKAKPDVSLEIASRINTGNHDAVLIALDAGYAVVVHPSVSACWIVGKQGAGTIGYIHSGNFHEVG